ncbi:MAG: hypothetical protein WAU77_10000 [Solirubrobacteraceae bacterium]
MADAILRANPGYELVLLDRLSEADRDGLGEALERERELYGVLRPRPGADLQPRTVSTDTALLFLTLTQAASLPSYVRTRLGPSTERAIARLVLDGVLEIEHNGELLSGARAGDALLAGSSSGGQGRIGELSLAALRYGQELAALGVAQMQLAARLYGYGRRPITAALRERLPSVTDIEEHLGIDAQGGSRALLDADWIEVAPEPRATQRYWRTWHARWAPGGGGRWDGGYKLYVSPSLSALGDALASVSGSLAGAHGVRAFKVAERLDGLCRPDKLVVYFDRLEDLQAGAFRLRDELAGTPAHGVPFTAAITSDGLLSWGADPPLLDGARASWRQWVTERLAEYLEATSGSGIESWQFALRRLRLAGIDPDSWVPTNGMWEEALASA